MARPGARLLVDGVPAEIAMPSADGSKGGRPTVADVRVTYDKTADAAYVYLTEPQAFVNLSCPQAGP